MMRRRGMGVIGTAVVVGGAAHYGTKKANEAAASQDQAQQAAYEQGLAAAQQQAVAAPAPVEDDPMAEVQKLARCTPRGSSPTTSSRPRRPKHSASESRKRARGRPFGRPLERHRAMIGAGERSRSQ